MAQTKQSTSYGMLIMLVAVALLLANGGGGGFLPVDSPFPADGYWLLLSSESGDLTGVAVVAQADVLRNKPNLKLIWQDYSQKPREPWRSALDWAKEKSSLKPYFVARKGNRAAEGPLTGDVNQMLQTIQDATEGW